MKKLKLLLICISFIATVGCSNRIVENDIETENITPSGIKEEIGNGEFVITTPFNESNNDVPVIFVDDFSSLTQIKFQSKEFDGSRCSYIYIDGKLNTIEQLGEMNSSALTVEESHLTNGIHKVEVIQFDNNKSNGTPVTYKVCNYEVRVQ